MVGPFDGSLWTSDATLRRYRERLDAIARRPGAIAPPWRTSPQATGGEEKPKRICLKNENVRRYVEEGLARGWSPEQIAGRLPIDCPGETTNSESIYTYIYNKRRDLTKFLTYGRAKRRKRAHAHAQRIVHANRRSIDERPPEVLDRRRHGHWEFDTAHGAHTEALAVSTERTTGFVQITPIERKTAAAMYHAIVSQFREIDRSLMRSLTCDNGSENAAHQRISETVGVPVYFCHPYHSWEKGSVENVIGLIRRVLPKRTDFSCLTPAFLSRLEDTLNDRPRKRFGFRTPREMMAGVVVRAGPDAGVALRH